MKLFISLSLILYSICVFSLENAREINVTTDGLKIRPVSNIKRSSFNLKTTLKSPKEFETFIKNHIQIIDINSPKIIENKLQHGTKGLFLESFFKSSPLLSEFIYQLIKTPKALSDFLQMFLNFNKLIFFSFFMIFTFILSHFMSEFKFRYDTLSFSRILFSLSRFSLINTMRISCFMALFSKNIVPIYDVFSSSLALHKVG